MPELFDDFHIHYYDSLVWLTDTEWLGVPIQKFPLDLWIFQEIIYEVKPDLIVECGTYNGGSALFFASMCDLMKKGRVISIDISPQPNLPAHPRLTFFTGSSTSEEAVHTVESLIHPNDTVMVVLDSDHTQDHVLSELRLYHGFVTQGSYLIVEDTNINGHPVLPEWGPGPMEALHVFLAENDQFQVDESRHKFFVTFHPRGFLRKVK